MPLSNPDLAALAGAYGIATEFWDWKGRLTEVDDETVVGVLKAMEVDASTPELAAAALREHYDRPWRRSLPPCVVMTEGTAKTVEVHVTAGDAAEVSVRLEDGGVRECRHVNNETPDREVDGRLLGEATFEVPGDLPIGYHRLQLASGGWTSESTLIVTPAFLGFPASMGTKRVWGYAVQLYSVMSEGCWGMGDLQDLADMATWAATQHFASYILVNPLHAAEPMTPIEPSPYLPSSRRYVNPLYIRPESIPEFAYLRRPERRQVRWLKRRLKRLQATSDRIDRNAIWTAKVAALRIVFDYGRSVARDMGFDDFKRREGRPLDQFATWCALVNDLGMDWREWPTEFQRPSSPEVAAFAGEHVDDIEFFSWMQWVADNQLRYAQSNAKDAGMRIGVMTDLAVGVSQESAEAWTLGEAFAPGVSVGAPPDHYNQLGQDWGQTPWRPDRLEELSYRPFRNMVAGALRHSGGVRIDHIMGLFRLWWIPEGLSPRQGTYVRYNHEAMVGIVVLEAYRQGALVVGEDLGTVEPWVRTYLRDRGILGTSIAWYESTSSGDPLPPEDYREYCMASVTTHDMPPTAGFMAKEHVKLQYELGLLTESLEDEMRGADQQFDRWREVLRDRGLLQEGADDVEEQVLAMHRYIAQSPARVLCAALTDAVGEQRSQNQPGTVDEYPNWRVPLAGPDGEIISLEDVFDSPRAQRLASVMNGFTTQAWRRR